MNWIDKKKKKKKLGRNLNALNKQSDKNNYKFKLDMRDGLNSN